MFQLYVGVAIQLTIMRIIKSSNRPFKKNERNFIFEALLVF